MKYSEMKNQSLQELSTLLRKTDEELFALRCELAVNRKLEKPHTIRQKKRDKARILTCITEKQRAS